MAPFIYCPLTILPIDTEPEEILHLGDMPNDASASTELGQTLPAQMLYDVHQTGANAAGPIDSSVPATGHALAFPPPPLLPELVGFSSVQPASSAYSTAPSRLRAMRTHQLDMRILSPSETRRYPRAYLMSLCFGEKHGNTVEWQTIPDGSAPLKFHGLVDTGGHANIWMYSNTSAMALIDKDGSSKPLSDSPDHYDRFVGQKSKLRYERASGPSTKLHYTGDETVELQPTTRVCGTYDANVGLHSFLPQFTLGAAVGFDPRLLNAPFDGIIGLGRSYPGRSRLGTAGLLQQLIDQHCIQDEEFYVCCCWESDRDLGYGFVSFGGWPADRLHMPTWDRISLIPNARDGLWMIHLEKITVDLPGTTFTHTETMNIDVMLDSGAAGTALPRRFTKPLVTAVHGLSKAQGFDGDGLSDDVRVSFTFKVTNAGPSPQQGQSTSRTIYGMAKKFFVIPHLGPGERLKKYYPLKFSDRDTYNVLGLNFFRTFYVGFIDRAWDPEILLSAQM